MTEFNHVTVMLNEAIDGLEVKPDGIYVDCTLGGGGHSALLLSHLTNGHLYSFDQDDHAIEYNKEHLKKYLAENELTFIHDNFRNLAKDLS